MKLYQKLVAILFFLFFSCPVFSPSIFGLTLYLYYFIPFLDFEFDKYCIHNIFKQLKSRKLLFSIVILLFFSIIFGHIVFAIELLLLIFLVIYLIYIYKKDGFKYLYIFMNINIIIGIVQFVSYYCFPDLLDVLNPTYIANFILGPYATGTYNNLYPSTLSIVRVSGLSREAGFFASLIFVSFLCYNFTYRKSKKKCSYYLQNLFFIIGFIISFSKVSILVIPAYFVLKYRNAINLIKTSILITLIVISGILFSNTLKIERYYDENVSSLYETFAHRFGGYTLLGQIDIKTALIGSEKISDLNSIILNSNYFIKHILKFDTVSGISSLLIQQGFIIAILFYAFLKQSKFKAAEVLFVSIITITVNYTTQTSFVVLAYFLSMFFILKEKGNNNRILIVNELIQSGGAETYIINLYKLLKKEKYDVKVLTFDDNFKSNIKKISNINIKDFYNFEIKHKERKINKLIFQPVLYLKLNSFLEKIQPKHIIINNVFSCPVTFYSVINGYDNIQVVHDAGIVCPKSTCIRNDKKICQGYKFQDCIKSCTYHDSKIQLSIKLLQLKVLEFLRKKVVRIFISPSSWLKHYLEIFDYKTIHIPNPIDTLDNLKIQKNSHFLYVGTINENKGIFDFIKIINEFKIDICLDIIGGFQYKTDEDKLNKLIKENKNIHYLGRKSNEETQKYIKQSHCLVVPSKCLENYPTTVLEAMANRTLIIGSNIGGIAELIDNSECLFELIDKKSVLKVIKNIKDMSKNNYDNIIQKNYSKIQMINRNDIFIKKIKNVLEKGGIN